MASDRWKQIESIYHAALERPQQERGRYLDDACADDAGLRSEVDSLLKQHSVKDFMDGASTGGPTAATRRALESVLGSPLDVKPGTRIDQFEVVAPIGKGGMGEVWKARDTKLGRFVAIKFVPGAWAADTHAVERLRSEARAASSLNHPNICTIYDFRELDGHPLIVMEFMRGQTLGERLAGGVLKPQQVVDIGIQVTDALVAAHGRGIIHRDIKPDNIFLTDDGLVKVLDFGLAKHLPQKHHLDTTFATESQGLSSDAGPAGTISYMSPEQASGEELDGRTDLFSLGVVLYACATGHPPFGGKTIAVVLSSILNRAPVAPVALNPEVPLRLQEVIYNCLEKDRELRYQSAGDLRAELKRVKRDLDMALSPGRVEDQAPSPVSVAPTATTTEAVPSPAPSRSRWVALAGIALVLLGATAAFVFYQIEVSSGEAGSAGGLSPEQTAAVLVIQSRLELAASSLEGGDYRSAAAHAGEVLRREPDNADAGAILAAAEAQLARLDAFVVEARRALAEGDTAGAQEAMVAARDVDPTAPVINELAEEIVILLNIETAEARELARQAANRPPTTPPPAPPEARTEPTLTVQTPPAATPPPEFVPPSQEPARVEEDSGAVAEESAEPPSEATGPEGFVAPATDAEGEDPVSPVRPAEPVEEPVQGEEPVAPASPPPEAAPPEAAPDPPAESPEAIEADIRSVIDAYATAIGDQDIDLLRQVRPNLSEEQVDSIVESFRNTPLEVEVTGFTILRLEADRATVRLERRDTFLNDRQDPRVNVQTLELLRREGRWVIDAVAVN
jgi:serine/threonine protein kinase